MAVDVVLDGEDALESPAVTRYDVVVLDRDLPESTATRCAGGLWPVERVAGC
jgi:DNA-binding response OmpR family regulator